MRDDVFTQTARALDRFRAKLIEMNDNEVKDEEKPFIEPYSYARLETLRVAGNKGRGAQPCRIRLSDCQIIISVSEIVSAIQLSDISWHSLKHFKNRVCR